MKMRRTFLTLGTTLAVAAGSFYATVANAVPTLTLDDPSTVGIDAQITDGGAGDSSALAGVVAFSGAVGSWIVNITTGLTKPIIGSTNAPDMDLNSVNVSGAAGTLNIWWSDDNFDGTNVSRLLSQIGGTTDGTVTAMAWVDPGNAINGMTTKVANLGPFGIGAFSGTTAANGLNLPNPFSMTQMISITHRSAGAITSLDFETEIPEPATLGLLGMGFLGLGFAARRRRSA